MGASGWAYRFPYIADEATTLHALQAHVLTNGSFAWPFEYVGAVDVPPRPTTFAELLAVRRLESYWESGTHSVLDMEGLSPDGAPGGVQPLTTSEYLHAFGTESPSAADLARVLDLWPANPLGDLVGPRWSGRMAVLREDGIPTEVYVWGWSGD